MVFAQLFRNKRQQCPERETAEVRMLRTLHAIPSSRWSEISGGFTVIADCGTRVDLYYWQINLADQPAGTGCQLFVGGMRVPIDGHKLEPLYRALQREKALHRPASFRRPA